MTRTHVANGQSIERYIPNRLKNKFYRRTSSHMFGRHNGLDPYEFTTNGLILYVPLWLENVSTFNSVDPYKHLSTVVGSLWTPSGRVFDSVDDLVNCGEGSGLFDFGTGDFSTEVWLNPSSVTGNQTVVGKYASGFPLQWWVRLAANLVITGHRSEAEGRWYVQSISTLDIGTWYHVVCQRNSVVSDYQVFINSVDVSNKTIGQIAYNTSCNNDADIVFGQTDAATENFSGTIGEVRVYNRALSDGEILHNFNATQWRYQ